MKCIKSTTKEETVNPVRRVSDTQAEKAVQTGKWTYCGKQEWKKTVRDATKTAE